MALPTNEYWSGRLKKRFKPVKDIELELARNYQKAYVAIYEQYMALLLPYTNNGIVDFKRLKIDLAQKASVNYALQRQQMLLETIDSNLTAIGKYEELGFESVLIQGYKDNYYDVLYRMEKSLRKEVKFSLLSPTRLKRAIHTRWTKDGIEFSSRVWSDKKLLSKELRNLITESIATGRSPLTTSVMLRDATNSTLYNSKRIIRTEMMAVITESDGAAYDELGIDRYEILSTFDSRTSSICQDKDGKTYKVSEMKIGTNAPPFHPNCRTTTIPVVEEPTELRFARGADGKPIKIPTNMTYEQFKAKHLIG